MQPAQHEVALRLDAAVSTKRAQALQELQAKVEADIEHARTSMLAFTAAAAAHEKEAQDAVTQVMELERTQLARMKYEWRARASEQEGQLQEERA